MSISPFFLLVLPTCPLGVSEEATVARALIQALRQVESRLEVLSGSTLGIAGEVDLGDWLAGRGVPEADRGRGTLVARDARGKAIGEAPYLRTTAMGVPLTSHRLGQVEVMTLADTSVRLWHWGRYGYGWEDAGSE